MTRRPFENERRQKPSALLTGSDVKSSPNISALTQKNILQQHQQQLLSRMLHDRLSSFTRQQYHPKAATSRSNERPSWAVQQLCLEILQYMTAHSGSGQACLIGNRRTGSSPRKAFGMAGLQHMCLQIIAAGKLPILARVGRA